MAKQPEPQNTLQSQADQQPTAQSQADQRDVVIANLIKQVENLTSIVQNQTRGGIEEPTPVNEYTCKVSFYKDKPITAIGKVMTEHRETGDVDVLPITVSGKGKDEVYTVEYKTFVEEVPRYVAVILDKQTKITRRHQGLRPEEHTTVNPRPVDEDGRPVPGFAPKKVVLSEQYQEITLKVRIVEGPHSGTELILKSDIVNIV